MLVFTDLYCLHPMGEQQVDCLTQKHETQNWEFQCIRKENTIETICDAGTIWLQLTKIRKWFFALKWTLISILCTQHVYWIL